MSFDENIQFSLRREISQFILLQQEGEYWDFKRQWYSNNGDLLHDIICMANNLSNHDAYIIIGIDEENNYSIVDVCKDPHRKNTQKIVDFLKDKKFVGGIRPIVYVQSLVFPKGEIDVVVVKNSHNTPFYLNERFEKVLPNNIYTRVMDTNTPIDKSADINNIEHLWRKRFYLDEDSLTRVNHYLGTPKDWLNSPNEENETKFYKFAPEFTIEDVYDDTRHGYEFYLFGQCDTTPSWYNINIYYFQTVVCAFSGATLDGGRCFIVCPERNGISLSDDYHGWDIRYCYYIVDSLCYNLHRFYQATYSSDSYYQHMEYIKCVLIFNSELERSSFEKFVKKNKGRYTELYQTQTEEMLPYFPDIQGYNMDAFKKEYKDANVLQMMLNEFRSQ